MDCFIPQKICRVRKILQRHHATKGFEKYPACEDISYYTACIKEEAEKVKVGHESDGEY